MEGQELTVPPAPSSEIFSPNKRGVFQAFAKWFVLSAFYEGFTDAEIEAMNIADPMEKKLAKIRDQQTFAKEFGIEPHTLSRWKKKKNLIELVDEYTDRWAAFKTPQVAAALFRRASSRGYAEEVKLFYQLFKRWVPQSEVKVDGKFMVITADGIELRKATDGKQQ